MKIAIGIGGASGAIYAKVLLDKINTFYDKLESVGVVMSKNAQFNWKLELGNELYKSYPFTFYESHDFMAPFASGSAGYDALIVCPCSMGGLARMANGFSTNLMERAADVMLKERKKLILVVRETPYSKIHLENMLKITDAGGIICPASPSFYSNPKDFEALVATVIDRVIDLIGIDHNTYRWGEE